jgi:2-polyprenyl-6-methoxyphenol hydroxylase-like FAD-dependent oxidoreductase
MTRTERILIIGGGLAGLTSAVALQRLGFEPELIERAPSWRALGMGIVIQPNAMRLLWDLGVGSDVEKAGVVVGPFRYLSRAGALLSEIDLSEFWRGVGSGVTVERGALQNALLYGVDRARCRLGVSVASLHQWNGVVSVGFSDGASADYDLVIGADGVGSTVRALAIGKVAPKYRGQSAWRALAPIRRDRAAEIQFWLGDGCFFTTYPVGSERTYGCAYIAEPNPRHEPIEGRLARFHERLAAFGDSFRPFLDNLEHDDQIHCSAVESLELPQWRNGRVLLIGDAAHASSPMMGQGGCMAIEDAAVLAQLLASSPTIDAALDAYSPRRRPRVAWVQAQSDALGRTMLAPAVMRDAVIRERGAQAFRDRYAPLLFPP